MSEMTRYEGASELLDVATDSWVATIAEVAKLAAYVCDTPFVPAGLRGNAPSTAATILYGREIGIPPITALQTMHVINGRVGMAAELMRARVLAAGHELEVMESTTALCRMRGRRKGSASWTEVQWSMGDARQAKLGGDNWTKYPRPMLVARCSAELCRLIFPDVTHGMAATEELDAMPDGAAPQAPPASQRRLVARAPRSAPQTPPQEASDTALPTPPAAPPVVATPEQSEGDRVLASLSAPREQPPLPGEEPEPEPHMPGEDPLPFVGTEHHPHEAPEPHPGDWDPNEVVRAVDDPDADPQVAARLTGDGPATQPQVRHIMVLLRRLNMGAQRDERLAIGEAITQRRLLSFSQLTVTDAGRLITTMLLAVESANPRDYMRWLVDEGQRTLAEREADTGVGGE